MRPWDILHVVYCAAYTHKGKTAAKNQVIALMKPAIRAVRLAARGEKNAHTYQLTIFITEVGRPTFLFPKNKTAYYQRGEVN